MKSIKEKDRILNDIKNLNSQRNKCFIEARRLQYLIIKKRKELK